MNKEIEKLQEIIDDSENIVFFGGAGVSTESNIPDFRSADGLYQQKYKYSPEQIVSHTFFMRNTEGFYEFYKEKMMFLDAKPNAAHKKLAELEKAGKLKAIITQNIDGLHQAAGSKNVLELHGTVKKYYCNSCGADCGNVSDVILSGEIPHCKRCGGIAKPRVVLYGEMLDENVIQKTLKYIDEAELLIIGGTSLAVSPANTFVNCFHGKYVVMINKTSTPYDERADLVIRDSIGKVFEAVGKLRRS